MDITPEQSSPGSEWKTGSLVFLKKAVRVYKGPFANRKLRGLDVKTIGEEHRLCDAVLQVEGDVRVLETSSDRIKVKGNARAEYGGDLHCVFGWLAKADVTEEGVT